MFVRGVTIFDTKLVFFSGNKILDQGCPILWYIPKIQNCSRDTIIKTAGPRMASK